MCIRDRIRVSIQQSRLCVADVSQRNPNVLYEVGIAHTLGKPTILLTSKIEEVPFDIRALRIVVYDPNEPASLRAELVRTIEVTLGQDRLEEAQRLVDIGNYRAAAALLGVVLEQDLRLFMERNSATKGGRVGAKPMSIGQSVTFLTAADLLANVDGQLLKQALRIRNRAVHEVKEVGRDEVLILLDAVQTFRRKYLALI